MSITSVTYLVFLAISLIVYYKAPARYRWWVLLADSLVFFFANSPWYTFAYLLVSVTTVFFATAYFERENAKAAKAVYVLTLIVNIGMLAVLKYTNLVINTVSFFRVRNGLSVIDPVKFIASLAISFYTLQIVGYLTDCYWKVTKRESNILKLFLFTSYFPQMISGPISKYSDLSEELFKEHEFDYDNLARGTRRMAFGIAKKVIVADRLAVVSGYLFADTDTFSGIWTVMAALVFAVQIYFDFSGCMDIVIGASKCFGIKLVENFRAPILSKTTQEYWQRWHITLGAWLKDYVMYPLLKTKFFVMLSKKFRKKSKALKKIPSYIASLSVWLLMGLWHGNSFKYILGEGLWFWFVIVLEQVLEDPFDKLCKALKIKAGNAVLNFLRIVRTFLVFAIGMVFFNAKDLFASFHMVANIFKPCDFMANLKLLYDDVFASFGGFDALLAVMLMLALQLIADMRVYNGKEAGTLVSERPLVVRWILYFAFVFLIIFEGAFGQSAFIYFGF